MLRVMLDTAPNDPSSLPGAKRPKFLNNHLTLSSIKYLYFNFDFHIFDIFRFTLFT